MSNYNHLKAFEEKTLEIIKEFQEEISSIRTSRPSAALVENIKVECYNSQMPLKHIASVSISPPNIIIVEPWDAAIVSETKKALEASALGVTPSVEGKQIKLFLPPLTKERKEILLKLLNSKKEDHRIQLRKIREEIMEAIKKDFEEKKISEDEKFRFSEEGQKIIEKTNKILDEKGELKEKEIIES